MTFESQSPLKWIYKGDVYLTVNDFMTLAGFKNSSESHIDIEDFKMVLKIFDRHKKIWAQFCCSLPRHETLATFKNSLSDDVSKKIFVFPAELRRVIEKILSMLCSKNIVSEVKIFAVNSDSCTVEFKSAATTQVEFDSLLGKLPLICPVEKIIGEMIDDDLKIGLDSLKVNVAASHNCELFKNLLSELGADDVKTNIFIKTGSRQKSIDCVFTKGLSATAINFSSDEPEGWVPFIKWCKVDTDDFDSLEKILVSRLCH